MRLGIIGSRDFKGKEYDNYGYIAACIESVQIEVDAVVSGGGKGVETLVEKWAKDSGKEFILVPPNVKTHGSKQAFVLRNIEIAKKSDFLILFWDGVNSYLNVPLSQAVKDGKRVIVLPME